MARLSLVSASTMGMGLLGAMYTIVGVLLIMSSLGPSRSCRPLADFFLAQWVGVHWSVFASSFGLVIEVFGGGCDAAWLLCGLPHRHRHEVGLGEASSVVRMVGVFGGCGMLIPVIGIIMAERRCIRLLCRFFFNI